MRQTPLLKIVLELLEKNHKHLSVPDLQQLLEAKGFKPNKTTLYRMLEKLVEDGLVETPLLDTKVTYYELKTYHHHHFRCESCDAIKCIADPELESQIHALEHKLEAKGLKITNHNFSLSGKCLTCA